MDKVNNLQKFVPAISKKYKTEKEFLEALNVNSSEMLNVGAINYREKLINNENIQV